jgi:hypothetical protein
MGFVPIATFACYGGGEQASALVNCRRCIEKDYFCALE